MCEMEFRFQISPCKISSLRSICLKIDEGRENNAANTLRGTLLLRMATLDTLAKQRRRHPLKAPCLHLSQIGTSIVKKQKERALSLPGKLPAPYKSRDFAFEIWEREAAPADYCLMRRLSMDSACLCPSPPPKILTDDKLRLDKHTPGIPVHGCCLAVCSLYVQLVLIESFSLWCAVHVIAQPLLCKTGLPILSSTSTASNSRPYCTRNYPAHPGDFVRLSVSTGMGMDRETLKNLFGLERKQFQQKVNMVRLFEDVSKSSIYFLPRRARARAASVFRNLIGRTQASSSSKALPRILCSPMEMRKA